MVPSVHSRRLPDSAPGRKRPIISCATASRGRGLRRGHRRVPGGDPVHPDGQSLPRAGGHALDEEKGFGRGGIGPSRGGQAPPPVRVLTMTWGAFCENWATWTGLRLPSERPTAAAHGQPKVAITSAASYSRRATTPGPCTLSKKPSDLARSIPGFTVDWAGCSHSAPLTGGTSAGGRACRPGLRVDRVEEPEIPRHPGRRVRRGRGFRQGGRVPDEGLGFPGVRGSRKDRRRPDKRLEVRPEGVVPATPRRLLAEAGSGPAAPAGEVTDRRSDTPGDQMLHGCSLDVNVRRYYKFRCSVYGRAAGGITEKSDRLIA